MQFAKIVTSSPKSEMYYLPVYIKIQLMLKHACSRGKKKPTKTRNMYLSFKVEVLYPQVQAFLQILLAKVTKGLQCNDMKQS